MKCKYRFSVSGNVRIDRHCPVPTFMGTLNYITDNRGQLQAIEVTVTLKPDQWPSVVEDPRPGVRAHVSPNLLHLPFIQQDLVTLQGLLVLFGLESIDTQHPNVEWVPESDEERARLQLMKWTSSTRQLELEVVPFDLVARSAIASHHACAHQIPLNFYRRGVKAVAEMSYVDAIYQFYFVLETLFGQGKSRRSQVKGAFRGSASLMRGIDKALGSPPPPGMTEPALALEYNRRFKGLSPEKLVDHIVDLRGDLHHHSLHDRRGPWHPEEQHVHRVDALMLQNIAMNVVWEIVEDYLYRDAVIGEYLKLTPSVPRQ